MQPKQSRSYIDMFILGVFGFVAVLILFFIEQQAKNPAMYETEATPSAELVSQITVDPTITPVVINIEASDYMFTPSTIQVRQNDTVIINLRATDGFHNIYIPALGINTHYASSGKQINHTFVATQSGTFMFMSSFPEKQQQQMRGTLVVQPAQ